MPRPPETIDQSTFTGQVAAMIRARRLKLKLTAAEAAERAELPASTWYALETGRHLTLERLPAVAKALACKVRALIPADA